MKTKIIKIFKHKNLYIYYYFIFILNENNHFKRMLDYLKNNKLYIKLPHWSESLLSYGILGWIP